MGRFETLVIELFIQNGHIYTHYSGRGIYIRLQVHAETAAELDIFVRNYNGTVTRNRRWYLWQVGDSWDVNAMLESVILHSRTPAYMKEQAELGLEFLKTKSKSEKQALATRIRALQASRPKTSRRGLFPRFSSR